MVYRISLLFGLLAGSLWSAEVSVNAPGTQYFSSREREKEVHVLGIYQSEQRVSSGCSSYGNVSVNVEYDSTEPMKPITLVVTSIEPNTWTFNIDPGVVIEDIIVNGFYDQQVVNTGDIPVSRFIFDNCTGFTVPEAPFLQAGWQWPHSPGGEYLQPGLAAIEDLVGAPITSFTGAFEAQEFSINGSPTGTVQLGEEMSSGNLVDGLNANLEYDPNTGDVVLDFIDVFEAVGEFAASELAEDGPRLSLSFATLRYQFVLANEDGLIDAEALNRDIDTGIPPVFFANQYRVGVGPGKVMPNDLRFELGAVLPPGMQTLDELSDFLDLAHYVSDISGPFAFEVPDENGGETLMFIDEGLPGSVGEFDLIVLHTELPCDFNDDGLCNGNDIDRLMRNAEGGGVETDMNDDGLVNNADRDIWLAAAANAAGRMASFPVGDSNLDGSVNAADLNAIALSWQQVDQYRWTSGNYVATDDPGVNARDLNALALNWQATSNQAAAVPEPRTAALIAWLVFCSVFLPSEKRQFARHC